LNSTPPGRLPGLQLQCRQAGGQFLAQFGQHGGVDADTGGFHGRQHRLQRQFHLPQQLGQGRAQLRQLPAQQAGEPPG